jgi:hypothetical protein
MMISAFFYGDPGSDQDLLCEAIFEDHGGKHQWSETSMFLDGSEKDERNVTYDVPDDKVEAVAVALEKAGFWLTPKNSVDKIVMQSTILKR